MGKATWLVGRTSCGEQCEVQSPSAAHLLPVVLGCIMAVPARVYFTTARCHQFAAAAIVLAAVMHAASVRAFTSSSSTGVAAHAIVTTLGSSRYKVIIFLIIVV